jgi:predicted metalloprotease
MTKIRETRNTSMIDDRRGRGGSGGGGVGFPGLGGGGMGFPMKAGGGIIGVIVMIAVIVLPQILGGEGTSIPGLGTPSLGAPVGETASGSSNSDETCDDELESILCGATIDVQEFWIREFEAAGREYPVTKTVFFSGFTDTGCGNASAETGPFYCPADNLVYFDLDFLVQLLEQFGATGDLASQYIVAHEYGHHVQNVLGISDQVREAQRNAPSRANEYSVALELQADCLAGVWAHDADRRGQFERGEIAEALEAAAAVGDDRIQMATQGRTDPETFTHGTSAQRQTWFNRGFETGDIDRCNTFDG